MQGILEKLGIMVMIVSFLSYRDIYNLHRQLNPLHCSGYTIWRGCNMDMPLKSRNHAVALWCLGMGILRLSLQGRSQPYVQEASAESNQSRSIQSRLKTLQQRTSFLQE